MPNGRKGPKEPAKGCRAAKNARISAGDKLENQGRLSIIIGVEQDENTIVKVLRQAEKLCPLEIVVVVHGSRDRSLEQVLTYAPTSAMRVYAYPYALGEDVWRAIGAQEAAGDVWLFLEGKQIIAAQQLQPFVRLCYRGTDIALRQSHPFFGRKNSGQDSVQLAKCFLNSLLERGELGSSSMDDLPFAMTREAAVSIGTHHLFVPAAAHLIALQKELRVAHVRTRQKRSAAREAKAAERARAGTKALTDLGDHLEAFSLWQREAK
ncbi:glycosyl transferase [Brevibacillus gelatini]|uniref:Glycosyl transferase n=1 Tax=Brevibacillus gelatini TaxID=1655277 RepID=A0A3M8B699_9BACL|nr:glycosyl transferase [Brevibacillus gelatini]